jgi:hypothetical protein
MGKAGTGLIWLRIEQVVVSSGCSNKTSGLIKIRRYIDQLRNYKLFKKVSYLLWDDGLVSLP